MTTTLCAIWIISTMFLTVSMMKNGDYHPFGNSLSILPLLSMAFISCHSYKSYVSSQGQIVVCRDNTCVLRHGQVQCWGNGAWGIPGQGNDADIGDKPNEMGQHLNSINLGTGFVAKEIICGGEFVCALSVKNELKCKFFLFLGFLCSMYTNN